MSGAVTGPRFAPARVEVERRADGSMILRSPEPLRPIARACSEWLVRWAAQAPERTYLAERSGDGWRRVSYAEALEATRRIGGSLLARGLTASTPVAILSDNSISHALVTLGAMHAGIPVAPISPAYSLVSKDHRKLKGIFDLLQPGLVFADDATRFAGALAAVGAETTPIAALLDPDHRQRADEACAAVGPDTIAKIRLQALVPPARHGHTVMLSGWGSTETAPLSTIVHFAIDRASNVGIPAPGIELKLLPSGSKLEVRVRGPNVTPGYYRTAELTRAAFDEEAFYTIGDAMCLVDAADPARGLAFDGRVAEDFKLQSGAWVHTGSVRVRLIAACDPLIQDAVITGHDRTHVGALVWLTAAARSLGEAELFARLQAALASLRGESSGHSMAPTRLLLLEHPPSIDQGEITDKGYINQRAVLECRAAEVEHLHSGGPRTIVAS